MKDFIYLVQGESDLIKNYFHLTGRDNADVIFLTYDKEIKNAIYYPNSTWSEGRNKLLEEARKKGDYQYYIFCDDDIEFSKGSWDEYENLLLKYMPAIGCPIFPKTRKTKINFMDIQVFFVNDEQLMAFHIDLTKDGIVLPYQTQFDKVMFWCSASIQEILIQNFYRPHSLQFNNIEILNKEHCRYDNSNKLNIKGLIDDWKGVEFKKVSIKTVNPNKHNILIRIKILIFTFKYLLLKKFRKSGYKVKKNILLNMLNKDSTILRQYNNLNRD